MDSKKLCVVVPFRDRYNHLGPFIASITPMLKEQNINYEILIVEQTFKKQFNRGMMKNIGFLHADADYYCFHDIDMLPVISDYSYIEWPTHLAVNVEQFGGGLPYDNFFGGVVLFTKEHFRLVQGYFNNYWGWGAEDDDLRIRCERKGLKLMRKNGTYSSLHHERPIINDEYSFNLQKYHAFIQNPEMVVNDLETCEYTIIETINTPEYTKITVEI